VARKCKQCKEVELPPAAKCTDIIQKKGFCSAECLVAHTRAKDKAARERKERKKLREAKERLKTRQDWIRDAQRWFNKWVRLRDAGQPCISCGNMPNYGSYVGGSGIHAGHYRSIGACPELRFEPTNVNIQCVRCNVHNSGNAVDYRIGLVEKIGLEKVEWLEGPHEPKKWTIDELKEIKAKYKTLCYELENQK
jgi:hypothetical protein